MTIKCYIFIQLLFLLFACSPTKPKIESANELILSESGYEFTLFQRKTLKIPSTSNEVTCSIDDITGGQTLLTVKEGNKILVSESIQENEVLNFNLNSNKYSIECESLINKLVGEDYGLFKIIPLSRKAISTQNETAKIETLLSIIENADVIFIRNGSEYDSKEAAEHLRSKWNEARDEVKTLDSFIKNIASVSSMSGKPYLIKLKTGNVITASEWYKQQLKSNKI